jgi:hypothetical protein
MMGVVPTYTPNEANQILRENDLSPLQRAKGWLKAVLLQGAFARCKNNWEDNTRQYTLTKVDNQCLEELKGLPRTLGSCSPCNVRRLSKQSQSMSFQF